MIVLLNGEVGGLLYYYQCTVLILHIKFIVIFWYDGILDSELSATTDTFFSIYQCRVHGEYSPTKILFYQNLYRTSFPLRSEQENI